MGSDSPGWERAVIPPLGRQVERTYKKHLGHEIQKHESVFRLIFHKREGNGKALGREMKRANSGGGGPLKGRKGIKSCGNADLGERPHASQ